MARWTLNNLPVVAWLALGTVLAVWVTTAHGVPTGIAFVSAIAVFMAIQTWPDAVQTIATEGWSEIAVYGGVVTYAFANQVTDSIGSDAFYATAAEIIPVLLLAMVLEVRLVRHRPTRRQMGMAAFVVALMVGGEVTALQSINRGHGSRHHFDVTAGALACGLIAIGLVALSNVSRDEEPKCDRHGERA